jgi:hypothetical protein
MTTETEWRPRVTIDLDYDFKERINKALPWGTRNAVMLKILEQLVEAIEREGEVVPFLILSGKLTLFGVRDPVAKEVRI